MFNRYWVDLEIHQWIIIQLQSAMSDPNLSDIDFKNKMVRVWTTLKIVVLNRNFISVLSVINGGRFDIGATKLIEKVMEITNRFRQLQIDRTELVCLKFLILFEVKEMVFNYLTSFHPIWAHLTIIYHYLTSFDPIWPHYLPLFNLIIPHKTSFDPMKTLKRTRNKWILNIWIASLKEFSKFWWNM